MLNQKNRFFIAIRKDEDHEFYDCSSFSSDFEVTLDKARIANEKAGIGWAKANPVDRVAVVKLVNIGSQIQVKKEK